MPRTPTRLIPALHAILSQEGYRRWLATQLGMRASQP